jgi:two-component system LytT family sensor kinase
MSDPLPDHMASRLPRGWKWVAWALLCTAIGLLNANHFYLNDAANGRSGVLLPYLLEELTGSWSAGALALLVLVPEIRRIRHQSWRWLRCVSHLGLLLGFSLVHTSLIWASRLLLFPLFGLGHYHYGVMSWRYPMEFPSDVIVYALTACLTWLADHYRAGRERELHAAALESALAEARLEALRLQLNPHFLFNALNAVSSTMYEQPRAADEMLARIGDLLRATLQARTQQHRLADELKLLRLYLDIQRARFGEECVCIVLDITPGLDSLQVPFLVLQPLAENAFEHSGAPRHDVSIHASSDEEYLHLRVRNQGDADVDLHRGHGIGLVNIQARLRYLYGEQAGLALQTIEGGTEAHLWLPLDAASA